MIFPSLLLLAASLPVEFPAPALTHLSSEIHPHPVTCTSCLPVKLKLRSLKYSRVPNSNRPQTNAVIDQLKLNVRVSQAQLDHLRLQKYKISQLDRRGIYVPEVVAEYNGLIDKDAQTWKEFLERSEQGLEGLKRFNGKSVDESIKQIKLGETKFEVTKDIHSLVVAAMNASPVEV